jgi:hypothetical protein
MRCLVDSTLFSFTLEGSVEQCLRSKCRNEEDVELWVKLRARLAQLQLLILSEDLEEPCQTGIFLN